LSGNKETIDQLLRIVALYTADIQSHSPFLLLLNDRTGDWKRVNALETPPPKIAEILRKMVGRLDAPNTPPASERSRAENF
jgi:hypothetical protein